VVFEWWHWIVLGIGLVLAELAIPAFFVICFGCVPAVVVALMIEILFTPPFWVHLVTSLPFLLLTCTLPLRPLKGWLVCSQFFYKAREARQIGWHIPER